jgi:hypothetical protein
MEKLKNLVSNTTDTNTIVAVENKERLINIAYNKRESAFMNASDFIKFVKTVEGLIRKSKEYASYIAYLKVDIGLTRCSIFGNIDDQVAKIEMHHGPIFTLYDYVEITLSHLFKTKQPVNSSNVAYNVLRDHFDNIIQVVMLSEAAHVAVHNYKGDGRFFVSLDSAWGDLTRYLEKYSNSLNVTHVQKIKKYMDEYNKYKNADSKEHNRMAIFTEYIKKWDISV